MPTIKTQEEIAIMREGGAMLARVTEELCATVAVGMTTAACDALAERRIREMGAAPAFKGYRAGRRAFPATVCLSINDEVVHGIPLPSRIIADGDLVKIDIGLRHKGFFLDMARTVIVGKETEQLRALRDAARDSLRAGLAEVRAGAPVMNYAGAVEDYARAHGFGVVRDLVGHGVGHALHEGFQVPNYRAGVMPNFIFRSGMTIAFEPMLTAGKADVVLDDDEWTFRTRDGSLSSHWEDSVVVTDTGVDVLTTLPGEK